MLCVFSKEEQFFQKDIIDLMEQLAMEASFALESLQREADRRYQAAILADQNRILNLVASGADLKVIFATLAQFLEAQSDGGFCSLVALDQKESCYALSVAPSLPAGFDQAGQPVAASHEEISAPCAEAISNRAPVVVDNLGPGTPAPRCGPAAEGHECARPSLPFGQRLAAILHGSTWVRCLGALLSIYQPEGVPAR